MVRFLLFRLFLIITVVTFNSCTKDDLFLNGEPTTNIPTVPIDDPEELDAGIQEEANRQLAALLQYFDRNGYPDFMVVRPIDEGGMLIIQIKGIPSRYVNKVC